MNPSSKYPLGCNLPKLAAKNHLLVNVSTDMLPRKYFFSLDFDQVSPTKAFGKWVLTPVLPLEQSKESKREESRAPNYLVVRQKARQVEEIVII